MTGDTETLECARCGTRFDMRTDHTKIVRRDFVDFPCPSKVERLCPDCWRTDVDDFLGEDFEQALEPYRAEA